MPIRTIVIDMDYTLINDKDELYEGVLEKLPEWKLKYTYIIGWSRTGAEHARRVCKKHKIDKYFTSYMDKPDIIVDDRPESILNEAAVLKVENPEKWWSRLDKDIFQGCRENKFTPEKEEE